MPASPTPATNLGAALRSSLLRLLAFTLSFVAMVTVAEALGVGTVLADTSSPERERTAPAWVTEAARLNAKHECSRTGLAEGAIPARAVVRVGRDVRVTSFEDGWAIYHGERRGTLLSVCAR
jgi:hypothetical protein